MEAKRGWASWSPLKKTLVVAGALIGLFLVAGLAAFAYGIYWLYGAGDQADTQIAISSTAVGYVRFVAKEDDPGVEETLARFAEAMTKVQSRQNQNVPAPLRALMEFQQSQAKGSFGMLRPRAVTASFEPSETNERQAKRAASEASGDGSEGFARAGPADRFVVAINMRGMGGFVKGMFMMVASEMMKESDVKLRSIEYRDHEILVPTATVSALGFSHYGSTILVGQEDDLKGMLDRAIDAHRPTPPARLSNLEKIVAPSSDLYWVHLSPPQVPSADVGLGLDVVTADRWQAVAIVRAASPEAAELATDATALKIAEIQRALAEEGIDLDATRSQIDPLTARWDLTITNVANTLEKRMMEELTRPKTP